ncbi:hypothetical protein AAHB65_08210 [Bacillus toyonensis]
MQSGLLTEEQFDEIVDPKKMIAPKNNRRSPDSKFRIWASSHI